MKDYLIASLNEMIGAQIQLWIGAALFSGTVSEILADVVVLKTSAGFTAISLESITAFGW